MQHAPSPCRSTGPHHRGHARHRPRRRPGLRPGRRAPHPGRPHGRRAGGGRRRDPRRSAAAATLLTLDLNDARQDRRAGPHHLPALGQARHPRRQRRHPRAAVAARPRHGGCLERGDGDQPHRQLASDPHARPAAAPLGSRPRHLRLLRRGGGNARLLGSLCRLQGGARSAGARPTPTRWPTRPCASIWSIPGRSARPCAPRPSPARIPPRCRWPEDITAMFVELAERRHAPTTGASST